MLYVEKKPLFDNIMATTNFLKYLKKYKIILIATRLVLIKDFVETRNA